MAADNMERRESDRVTEQALGQIAKTLTDLTVKIDNVDRSVQMMQVSMAEQKAYAEGHKDNIEHRLTGLEEWREGVNKYIVGIILALVTGILVQGISYVGAHLK